MSDNTNIYNTYVDQLHQSAATGNVTSILESLKVVTDVNAANSRGWTALMFAARNGHKEAALKLLDKGADTLVTNSVGQTASDIAEFWQHRQVAEIISKTNEGQASAAMGLPVTVRKTNYFCDSPLDRMSQRRTDDEWLDALKTDPKTVYIVLTQLSPIVKSSSGAPSYVLARFPFQKVKGFVDSKATLIFLGVEHPTTDEDKPPSSVGWFAVDGGTLSEEQIGGLEEGTVTLATPLGYMQLSRSEAAIVGQARSMLAWHERYKFCSTCGSPTELKEAGYKRVCLSEGCSSNKGVHNTAYPRTDPTVIMAVMSPDRTQILLGRPKRYRAAMWSCLAGFMEPGESIEEACRREVQEESNIKVGRVDYHSCQPWPMPSSLMIGCIAQAETTAIKVDKNELEDARWFGTQEVRQMLLHQHPNGLFCPPEQAIAHQLIKYWLNNMCKL